MPFGRVDQVLYDHGDYRVCRFYAREYLIRAASEARRHWFRVGWGREGLCDD